jgi:hypothetical protein
MNQFEAKAFIGNISEFNFKNEEGQPEVKYFAKIVVPHEDKENERIYQYVDCYVSKSLRRLFASVYATQTDGQKGSRPTHFLSSQIATVKIVGLFFDINESGYLAGKGILSSLTFD